MSTTTILSLTISKRSLLRNFEIQLKEILKDERRDRRRAQAGKRQKKTGTNLAEGAGVKEGSRSRYRINNAQGET